MTTDGTNPEAVAAAAGAAAAVTEVQDQQADAERAAGMEAATTVAAESAALAEEHTAEAEALTGEAVTAATEALTEAEAAQEEATTAVAEATEARSEVAQLSADLEVKFGLLHSLLDERLPKTASPSAEPEEVTVGDHRPNPTAESGADGGSESSAESGQSTASGGRPSRHRFGSRRPSS